MKQMQKYKKPFEDLGDQKSIKKRSKIISKGDLKLICHKNTQKYPKKWPTWVQYGLKLGPCRGAQTVLGPPKRTSASTPRATDTSLDFRPAVPGAAPTSQSPNSYPDISKLLLSWPILRVLGTGSSYGDPRTCQNRIQKRYALNLTPHPRSRTISDLNLPPTWVEYGPILGIFWIISGCRFGVFI